MSCSVIFERAKCPVQEIQAGQTSTVQKKVVTCQLAGQTARREQPAGDTGLFRIFHLTDPSELKVAPFNRTCLLGWPACSS